ncbi:hypothetical protein CR205_10190 [Alteribacter lacisalsi]|uniref:Uncharacterized protein n=1 Tax=Alteribacter lacisalsi TaxID=2045244 RepID=A0A2W0HAM9_9BACI|nr:hypothetical protein [Alteribacter lacisalsi]PYZ98914.1 hypothetical protein CR205_10190 [Alteribacter lacisalsi]
MISEYYDRTSRKLIWLGGVMTALTAVFTGWHLFTSFAHFRFNGGMELFVYGWVVGPGLLITGIVKKKLAVKKLQKPPVTDADRDLFSARRTMILTHMHWLREYEIYAMDGTRLIHVKEKGGRGHKAASFVLQLVGVRSFLKKRLVVENNGDIIFYIEKERGINAPYYLLDRNRNTAASYKMNLLNPMKQFAVIRDGSGNVIGENDGKFSGIHFKVRNKEGEQLIELFHQGIPSEAINMFGWSNGDMLVTNQSRLSEDTRPAFILAPVIVKLHFS